MGAPAAGRTPSAKYSHMRLEGSENIVARLDMDSSPINAAMPRRKSNPDIFNPGLAASSVPSGFPQLPRPRRRSNPDIRNPNWCTWVSLSGLKYCRGRERVNDLNYKVCTISSLNGVCKLRCIGAGVEVHWRGHRWQIFNGVSLTVFGHVPNSNLRSLKTVSLMLFSPTGQVFRMVLWPCAASYS